MKKLFIYIGAAALLLSVGSAEAAVCENNNRPTCAALGYRFSAANCNGYKRIKCPWNGNAYFCYTGNFYNGASGSESVSTSNRTCSALGFDQTAENCQNIGLTSIPCPFDSTKVYCGGSSCIGDGYTYDKSEHDGVLPVEGEHLVGGYSYVSSVTQCPSDSNMYKVQYATDCFGQGYMTQATCEAKCDSCTVSSCTDHTSYPSYTPGPTTYYSGTGCTHTAVPCKIGMAVYSNGKCYNGTAPAGVTKVAVVVSLSPKLAIGINAATSVTPRQGSWNYATSGTPQWDAMSNLKQDKARASGSTTEEVNTAGIRTNSSKIVNNFSTYCPYGGFIPTFKDLQTANTKYNEGSDNLARCFSNNGASYTPGSTLLISSVMAPYRYGTGQYHYCTGCYAYHKSNGSGVDTVAVFNGGAYNYGPYAASLRCFYTFDEAASGIAAHFPYECPETYNAELGDITDYEYIHNLNNLDDPLMP